MLGMTSSWVWMQRFGPSNRLAMIGRALMVFKSFPGLRLISVATCVVGICGPFAKQDHPAYIPHARGS